MTAPDFPPDFPPEVTEKAALALFVARYDRQPIPESFDDSRHHDCRVFARAVLGAVADDLRAEGYAEAANAFIRWAAKKEIAEPPLEIPRLLGQFTEVVVGGVCLRARADKDQAALERVRALADECASSDCIHLNDLWGRLRSALDGAQ